MFHVYSKLNCPLCDQAKALLASKNLSYWEFILDEGQSRVEGTTYVSRDEVLGAFPGAKSMPQIALVEDGNFQRIGGLNELKATLT